MVDVILYARVSGKEQGRSGLGLENQIAEMTRFCSQYNLNIIDVRKEVISGKYYLERRPVLQQAFKDSEKLNSRKNECYVLAYRLDRLSRETGMVCDLLRKNYKFMTVETGFDCSPMILQIRASVAEEERRKAGDRSRGACAVKRAKGVPMGMNIPRVAAHREKAKANCIAATVGEADSFAQFMKPTIMRMRRDGMSVNAIADELNLHGNKTQRGGKWYAKTVANIMARWE